MNFKAINQKILVVTKGLFLEERHFQKKICKNYLNLLVKELKFIMFTDQLNVPVYVQAIKFPNLILRKMRSKSILLLEKK